MDLGRTITEFFARLIAFHNAFNLNVRFTYGALARLDTTEVDADRFMLPNGGEPWGNKLSWSDMGAAVQDAAAFISELGVVRSVSSFEDYVTGATAELNRAGARNAARPTDMREPAPERPATQMPYLPRHGHHRLSRSRRHSGERTSHGRPRKSAHHQAL
jgi:hypothetical protein